MSDQGDLLAPEPETTAPVVLNTPHARDLLRKRYPAPEWALMEEVAPSTGGGTRYADAVAVNLWQSRGHAIHGFEIKVSRSDWLRELKDPSKAEPVYRYCDHWWIVAPKGIVKAGELPPNWGLLEVRAASLVQVEAAKRLEPVPITRAFFASLMRRGHEQVTSLAERMQRQAVNEARAEVDQRVQQEVERRTTYHRELEERVVKFQQETGLEFSRYSGPPVRTIKLAQRLEALQGWKGDRVLGTLDNLAKQLEKAAGDVRKAMADTELEEPKA